MGLGHRAGDDDIGELAHERDAVVVGEGGVGFVDDEQARENPGERADDVRREGHAERSVRIGQEEERGAAAGDRVDVEAHGVRDLDLDDFGMLGGREHRIERVARVEHADRAARAGVGADQQVEDVVGTVAGDDVRRRATVEARGGLAQGRGVRRRVETQRGAVVDQGDADGLERAQARRIRVLVGVELDPSPALRLLTGDVRRHGRDMRVRGGNLGGHQRSLSLAEANSCRSARVRPASAEATTAAASARSSAEEE